MLRLLRSRSIGDRSFAFLHAHSISLVALRDDRCCEFESLFLLR